MPKTPIQLTTCLHFDTEAQREAWKRLNQKLREEGSPSIEQIFVNAITRTNETEKSSAPRGKTSSGADRAGDVIASHREK